MLLSINNFGSGHFTGRKLAGTGPDWSQNGQKRLKIVTNGQKWAFLTCNLLQMVGPDGGHIFEKKIWPRPFWGPGPGLFLGKKRLKTTKNGQNGLETGLKRVETAMFHFKLVRISLSNVFSIQFTSLSH